MPLIDVGVELLLEGTAQLKGDVVDVAVDPHVDDDHLFLHGEGIVLVLLENFHHAGAPGELGLGGRIQLAPELGKGLHLAVLGEVEPEATSDLLHGLYLRRPTDTTHREPDVDGGPHAPVEETAF